MKKTLIQPRHPERICWGCDKFCPADDLACGNGTIRTPHPVELFGDDWLDWAERPARQTSCSTTTAGGAGDGEGSEQGEVDAEAHEDCSEGTHATVPAGGSQAAGV